jgi:Uma2 family endonuclease
MTDAVGLTDEQATALPRMTFEEWLEWDTGVRRTEWVDGEVIYVSPVNVRHQQVLGFLYELVARFVRHGKLGQVFLPGVAMRLITRPSAREPDLLFVNHETARLLRNSYVDGPADLAVELVSPDSVQRDHVVKLAEYEAGRVPEYWVIDLLRDEAHFYQLGDDGRYRSVGVDPSGWYHSRSVAGFRFRPAWLWQRPLPDPDVAFAELCV